MGVYRCGADVQPGYEARCDQKCTRRVNDSSRLKACCTLEDAEDTRSVAYRLGMQYYVFNFKEDFRNRSSGALWTFERGDAEPCIDCNRYMKFEYQRARVWGMTPLSGLYARIAQMRHLAMALKKAKYHQN
ncbi:MAG: hypothetical protein ACLT2C_01170 [Ruminococcus sp.]